MESNAMRAYFAQLVKRFRVALAVRLVAPYHLNVYRDVNVVVACEAIAALTDYTLRSGHLTCKYKAGQRVRSYLLNIVDAIAVPLSHRGN